LVQIDMSGKSVLITGGTKGIGLASALEFARAGARTYLTFKWGSADQKELFSRFDAEKTERPVLLEADVSVDADTDRILAEIAKTEKKLDIFISNVGFAQRTMSLDDYQKRSLFKTLEYSTWPMVEYTRKIKKVFGKYPGYVIGISSDGPDHFYQGYDFVAASKALLEFFGKYLSVHLAKEGSHVNVIRFGTVKTESFSAIFGEEFFEFIRKQGVPDDMVLTPEDCGRSVFALCSGYMDAVNGQIVTADRGMPFSDNTMMRYLASKAAGPENKKATKPTGGNNG
jgi:NAD(P)-dependent dehydrogenase (short-subunit alcohol dehydrogenase family)